MSREQGGNILMSPYVFLLPGVMGIAITYGIGRYAYGFFLPTFIDRFSLTLSYTGYLSGFATALYALVSVLSVFLANKIRPMILIILGGAVTTLGVSIVTVSNSSISFSVGIVLASLGAGIMPPAYFEYIGHIIESSKRNIVTIIISTGGAPGLVLSALSAYLFLEDWRIAWSVFSFASLLMLMLNAYLLPWNRLSFSKNSSTDHTSALQGIFPRGWLILFSMSFCYGIALNIYYTYSISFIDLELGIEDHLQLFWALIGISGASAFLVTAFLVDRLGPIMTIALSYLVLAFAFYVLDLWGINSIILSGFIFGIFSIVPNSACLVFANGIYSNRLSLGWGMTFVSLSLGMAFGVAVAGNIAENYDLRTTFDVVAATMLTLAFALSLYQYLPKGLKHE